ncbi:MAG: MFS transporter [Pseudomonadota bacterium]
MTLTKLGLLVVIFVDVAGQGLIIPIINQLITAPTSDFLPAQTTESVRHATYGLVIGVFYLSWFLGAVYISKLSDSIGRKNGMLICLAGALVGYVLTILAIGWSSLWLMLLGRAITGFTAGNQPIAQAAMADLSRSDAEKTKNLGAAVAALSLGLVAGPLIAGLLSDQRVLGDFASLSLPFYVAIGLVLVAMILIQFYFHDSLTSRAPLRVKPQEVFLLLWQILQHRTVLRVAAVFFCFMLVWNTCYVFLDAYLTTRFDVGTLGASLAILVSGASLALSSAYLVAPIGQRFSKGKIVIGAAAVMAASAALFVALPDIVVVFLAIIPLAAAFAVGYATLLSIFSASVSAAEQGWVMGVSTALWTLGAGLTSLLGGDLMGIDLRLPFVLATASALGAILLASLLWSAADVRQITSRTTADG